VRWLASFIFASSSALAIACVAPAGDPMGTYTITGTLMTQTCGGDTPAENPWTFDIRLTRNGNRIYWLQPAAPSLSGIIDTGGNVVFTTSEIFDLADPNDAGKGNYCGVVRNDTFTAALGTATEPSTFFGTLTYHYDLDEGATCSPTQDGLDTVPCDVTYVLAAQRSGP